MLNKSPFSREVGLQEMYNQILTTEIQIPSYLSAELQDFLRSLFDKNPETRLGNKGIEEIMHHSWLKDASVGAPFAFTVFHVNHIVSLTDIDIESNKDIDSPECFDEKGGRLISLFSLHSNQRLSRREAELSITTRGDNNQDRFGDLSNSQRGDFGGGLQNIGLSDLNTECLSMEYLGQEMAAKDQILKEPGSISFDICNEEGYDFKENEIGEGSMEEELRMPAKLASHQLNVATKFRNRHLTQQ